MSIFDKHMAKDKRESLELAEASREDAWEYPSFMANLFKGSLRWELLHPYPEQSKVDKEEGDKFLNKLEEFLKANLDPDEVDLTREIPKSVIDGLKKMGAFAIKVPKEYGGLGFSQFNYNRVIHLVGSYCGSTTALLSAHQSIGVPQPLILFGTDEQKKKYLPKFREGAISGFALTEPIAGSDPRHIKTTATAVEDGKFYLINGEKLWCTNGNIADIIVVMAATAPKIVDGKERPQITAFIVETNTPGFEVTYRCKFMGLSAIQNGLIKFNNVKVPKENILLGEGQGLKLAFITLNTGRLTLPAAVTGAGKWCLRVARTWAKERKQWGCPVGEHEAIASKISTMEARVFAMDAMTWIVSQMADDKKFDIRLEAAIAKLFCTEESWKVIDETLQIRGGRGYETKLSLEGRNEAAYAVERTMRDGRVNTILEGSSEIMHLFIAREALDFHLKKMTPLLDSKVSIGAKVKIALPLFVKYAFWYIGLYIPSFCANNLSAPLGCHMGFVRKSAKQLARTMFHKMAIYQQKLANRQNIINRFVDIGMDLFAISCVCSYAEALVKKDPAKKNSLELADLFCLQARNRIRIKFEEIASNNDRLSNSIAKKALNAEFEWLEDTIIKK